MYYRATLQYDGTGYKGFQWQEGMPTIQNDLNLSLKSLIPGKISTLGASRTDTGVHAMEQIVKITSENPIDCSDFILNLNKALPSQIRCLNLAPTDGSFNPIMGNASKEYRYLFTTILRSRGRNQRFIANYPYELNIPLMQSCAQLIQGSHDFRNFCSSGSNVKSSIRDILKCEIAEVNPHRVLHSPLFPLGEDLKECFELKIVGIGFLKQMIRHLMSALWLVGRGKISIEEFACLLEGGEKKDRLWKVASPRGLYLYRFNLFDTEDEE
jgi:tRNA pseudouridine38-40 synthase